MKLTKNQILGIGTILGLIMYVSVVFKYINYFSDIEPTEIIIMSYVVAFVATWVVTTLLFTLGYALFETTFRR